MSVRKKFWLLPLVALFPHSLGLLYSAFTYYTGFKVNSGKYKVMGLAPYGEQPADDFHWFPSHQRKFKASRNCSELAR